MEMYHHRYPNRTLERVSLMYTSPCPRAQFQLSHENNPLTFYYTGCLIGILIMVYNNPHITG